MPLIRYKMNDLVKLTNQPCSCGLKTPRILPPIGRAEERVVFKNFYRLYGHQINEALIKFGEIAPVWQLIVDDKDSKEKITLLVESDKPQKTEKQIAKHLRKIIIDYG